MPQALKQPKVEPLLTGAVVQLRVIKALVIREMMQRYGRANVGFLWFVLEPLILTAGVLVLWSSIKPAMEHGVAVVSLVMTGYMPLTLWRHMTNAGLFAFRRSVTLLYHRKVTFLDVLLARMFLEFAGTTIALLFVYSFLVTTGYMRALHDLGIVLLGWVSMGILSLGFASLLAIATEWSEVTERFVQPVQYFMLPLSGSFYMVHWLPYSVQKLALYNPTVHCYEMFRSGIFDPGLETHFTPWYPGLFGLALFAIALQLLDSVRERLHTG